MTIGTQNNFPNLCKSQKLTHLIPFMLGVSFRMLEKSLDINTMRVQDTIPFISIIVKISSRKQVWDYVTKNYQHFKDR